ncbi:hypothetical protein B0H19DRAFT_694345 [Mycena capillaripes]|nr:hypothetical protein B0H19DRAFT_694345 [Mycena capillaripes]
MTSTRSNIYSPFTWKYAVIILAVVVPPPSSLDFPCFYAWSWPESQWRAGCSECSGPLGTTLVYLDRAGAHGCYYARVVD